MNKIQMAKQQPEAVVKHFSLVPKVINGAFFMPMPLLILMPHASCFMPQVINGGIAGIVGISIVFPLDLVKVCLNKS